LVNAEIEVQSGWGTAKTQDYLNIGNIGDIAACIASGPGGREPVEFWSEERTFRLRLAWDSDAGHLVFTGELPPTAWHWAAFTAQDPLLFRKGLRMAMSFEFWMSPEMLEEPDVQLRALLDRYRELERRLGLEEDTT
jgi:hypothetical protein